MEQKLEILTDKLTNSRSRIAKILVKDFEIDQEFADSLAFSVSVDALGTEKYEEHKKAVARRQFNTNVKKVLKFAGVTIPVVLVGTLVLWLVYFLGSSFIGWWTRPAPSPYPRVYTTLYQTARFQEISNASYEDGTAMYGISSSYQMCISGYDVYGVAGKGTAKNCLNPKKLQSLTDAMDKAVKENFDGLIWNESNGNGEWWYVERKNKRFIITALEE